jgi:hypothetical protein
MRFAHRLDVVGHQAVEELVDDRLEAALRALGQYLDAERLAALARDAHRFRPARRKRIHARIPDAGTVERRQRVRVGLVVDQRVDGARRRHRREACDVLW